MDDFEDYPTPISNSEVLFLSEEDFVFLRACGISVEGMRREEDMIPFEDVE